MKEIINTKSEYVILIQPKERANSYNTFQRNCEICESNQYNNNYYILLSILLIIICTIIILYNVF